MRQSLLCLAVCQNEEIAMAILSAWGIPCTSYVMTDAITDCRTGMGYVIYDMLETVSWCVRCAGMHASLTASLGITAI